MTERWFTEDVERELGISAATWRSYVARWQAPRPAGTAMMVGPTLKRVMARPYWDPDEVRAWFAARPGKGNWRGKHG